MTDADRIVPATEAATLLPSPSMTVAGPTFSYRQALEMLPAVQQLTRAAVSQVEALINRIQSREEMARRRDELQLAMETIIDGWTSDVTDLGCEVKGLWLVDWDSGDGYYCWRYPEKTIAFFHSYDDGFAGRVPIN